MPDCQYVCLSICLIACLSTAKDSKYHARGGHMLFTSAPFVEEWNVTKTCIGILDL